MIAERDPAIDAKKVKRVIACSGKVYFDLVHARREREDARAAIIRVEQLYPFPHKAFAAELKKYPGGERGRVVPGRAGQPGSLVLRAAPSAREHGGRPEARLCGPRAVGVACGRLLRQAHASSRRRCSTPPSASSRASSSTNKADGAGRSGTGAPSRAQESEHQNNMAIVEVKVPQLSESVAEATLLQWKKKSGEAVAMDEILIEVETDKVVLEVPAPAAGVMAEIVRGDGSTVVAGELIARLDTEGKAAAASPRRAAPPLPQRPLGGSCRPRPPPGGSDERRGDAGGGEDDGRQGHSGRTGARHRPRRAHHQGRRDRRRRSALHRARRRPQPRRLRRPRRARAAAKSRRRSTCRCSRTVRSSACRCRACASASPSGWCSRNRPPPS